MKYFGKYCHCIEKIGDLLSMPLVRARKLRGDESGNVMLLSGIMAFLFTIFALMSLDTSQAIYNRIIAQNAVDAAADAAALWQARGCNMVQNLNNYHYDADQLFATTEATALNACSFAFLMKVASSAFPAIDFITVPLMIGSCIACDSAPLLDDGQAITATGITVEQKLIVATMPFMILAAANDAAEGSGADDLLVSAGNWGNQATSSLGINLPGLQGVSSDLSALVHNFGFTVRALPLDPQSLELGLTSKKATLSPWVMKRCSLEVAAGRETCSLWNPGIGDNFTYEKHHEENWGWYDDLYYTGHPGFMTWIAGKNTQPELAGLGFLRWLNPNPAPPQETAYWLNQSNLPMYKDSATSSSAFQIPAYIALASSQVDGAPRTRWSDVGLTEREMPIPPGAYPYLIPVNIPVPGLGSSGTPIKGTSVGIYH